jgi:hypothetical protein
MSSVDKDKSALRLIVENARISLWLLIIVTGLLGWQDKIPQDLLPYLLGFFGALAVGGENTLEFLGQRFFQTNAKTTELIAMKDSEVQDLRTQVRVLTKKLPKG